MAQQTINIGTIANDGTGDSLRDAMAKANGNFNELYLKDSQANFVKLTAPASSIGATGDLAGMIAFAAGKLYICELDYDGASDIWQEIDVSALLTVQPW